MTLPDGIDELAALTVGLLVGAGMTAIGFVVLAKRVAVEAVNHANLRVLRKRTQPRGKVKRVK